MSYIFIIRGDFVLLLDVATTCDNVALLGILVLVKRLLSIVQIVVPIMLIIWASIGFIDMIRTPEQKDGIKKITNKFLAAVIVFFVPVIMNALMGILGESTNFSECWNHVNSETKIAAIPDYIDDPDLQLGFSSKKIYTDSDEYEKGKRQSDSDNDSSSYTTPSASNFLDSLDKMSKKVQSDASSGNKWHYSNSNTRKTFSLADKETKSVNCALYVVWGLVDVSALKPGQSFYKAYKNGKNYVAWSESTKKQIQSVANIIDGAGQTAKSLANDGKLVAGDIVLWNNVQHTNVYAGNQKFYDAGRCGTNGSGSHSNYKFSTLGPVKNSFWNAKVWKIIRLR